MITIYPHNTPVRPEANSVENTEQYLSSFWNKEVAVLSSARAGLYLALQYYSIKRPDHVLVPDYLCQAVLNVLNKTSFPVKYADPRTRVIFLFHQWGFPQKMDEVMEEAKKRRLLVIEDCAHSFNSSYHGQPIGTFGDAAVFSFPKLFPAYIGGTITSGNPELLEYIKKERAKRNNISNRLFYQYASSLSKKWLCSGKDPFLLDAIYLKSVDFPNISTGALKRFPNTAERLRFDLEKRKNNYLYIKGNVKSELINFDLDQHCEVTPFCVPVFPSMDKLETVQGVLRKNNVFVEILHFDINRNMFKPDYRKCLAIPCHQNIKNEQLEFICKIVNES